MFLDTTLKSDTRTMLYQTAICLALLVAFANVADLQTAAARAPDAQVRAPTTAAELHSLLSPASRALPLVSAHRGGARPGFPENCLETFADTIQAGLALIEVDPRMTSDGQIVLHHDATLERTSTGSGKLADLTLAELQSVRLTDSLGGETMHRIPTLDDAIEWAKGKCVLVLDSKDVTLDDRIAAVERHHAEGWVLLIVYSLADAKRCHARNPDIMMEVMMTERKHLDAFEETGIPWQNIIAFVGHSRPNDLALLAAIHAKGACCMAGTSRYLDRQVAAADSENAANFRAAYRELNDMGVDVIETDIPLQIRSFMRDEVEADDR